MRTLASPTPAPPPRLAPVRSVVSPLLPVLLTLAVAAIGLSVLFAWLFPPAGGPGTDVPLVDITAESGVRFTHFADESHGAPAIGAGVVVFDANEDGAADLFFVNGAPWTDAAALDKRAGRGHALFRNDGQARFTDVTAASGLDIAMPGMAATAGDFDADGRPDLFVTGIGGNRLFRNVGRGRFEDVTDAAGVGGEANRWSTGAAWIDYDADGRLDLIVVHYARWPEDVGLAQALRNAELGRTYGSPAGFTGEFPTVYRNEGDGRFATVSDSAGVRDVDPDTRRPVPHALGVATLDANRDGRIDILISYAAHPPSLFLAQPDGRFVQQGAANDRHEGASTLLAAGGLAAGEDDDPAGLLLARRVLSVAGGAGVRSGPLENLGLAAADFDHDGSVELSIFDGAAVATGDLDLDGDLDVVVSRPGLSAEILRNNQRQDRPWLRLRLIATRSHPDAAGTRVEVHTPRGVLRRTHAPSLGLFAQSEPVMTFGLGDDARVRRIVIRWASGQVQELPPPELNRVHVVREP